MNDAQQQLASASRKQSTASINSTGGASVYDPPMLHPEEEEMDRKHLEKIITALRYYRKYAYSRVNKSENYLLSLPPHHQQWLAHYRKNLASIRDCIDDNQLVIKKMIRDREHIFQTYASSDVIITQQDLDVHALKIRHQDMENVQSTLKQFARDWSVECAEEREQSYKPIIDVIEKFFKPDEYELNEIKILVPGAGLGRLTYELACRGYECEGNEFSYFMLFASNFVLNHCTEVNQYTIYPWVHQYVNNLHSADQRAAVRFPDVCPVKTPPKGNITMSAGDFLQVYNIPDSYNCVATCFFIDCANNIIEFIETIYRVLMPGGIWVNLGPLLYHFSDVSDENSIEPSHEDLISIVQAAGFDLLSSETGRRTKYAQNLRCMLKSEYESVFWVCQKPLTTASHNYAQHEETNGSGGDGSVHPYRNGVKQPLQ